ncbi:MAG: signal peptide peptidase SppA [Bacteroidales bacterium]
MKKFLKYVFATFLGSFLGITAIVIIIVSVIAGSVSVVTDITNKHVSVQDSSFLVLNLNKRITEKTHINPFEDILPSQKASTIGLTDMCRSITAAEKDESIIGIIIQPGIMQAEYTSIFEIRKALKKFKKSGKPIYAYADSYSQKSYLLSSIADTICIHPQAMFELKGISSQTLFFKDLLQKIGIEPILIRTGKYKSAAESLVLDSLSTENRKQIHAYISNIWGHINETIRSSRPHITHDLSYYANNLTIWNAETARKHNFVDSVMYFDSFISFIKKHYTDSHIKDIPQIPLVQYMTHISQQKNLPAVVKKNTKQKIAVVLAEGTIDMGKGDDTSIGEKSYAHIIRSLRKDTTIQAIVLRINSGGGSALASDIIWHEVHLAAQEKPLIVSMGTYAASGGYYIATPAHTIVAEHSTLTGSIGVFGMLVRADQTIDKLGISFDTVKTHNFSDFGSPFRSISPREYTVLTNGIDDIYTTFKNRVAQGRNLSDEFVDSIAQGRIWSGTDALRLGLVDTLGTISDAIEIAAHNAEIRDDYTIEIFPKKPDMFKELSQSFFDSEEHVFSFVQQIFGEESGTMLNTISKSIPQKEGIYVQYPYVLRIE